MVEVLKCHPTRQPTGTISGSRPNVYNARWGLELDDQVDMRAAIGLATAVAPGGGFQPTPKKGDFFSWVSPGGVRTIDQSARALDFDLSHSLNDGKVWTIDVTWRQPVPGAWEEPDRVNVVPLSRRPYYWIEYYTETEEIFDALNLIDIGTVPFDRPRGTPGPLTTAAGEEVDLATDERLHTVLVCEKLVSSPTVSKIINDAFFGKLNSNKWIDVPKELSRPIDKFKARFLRSETTQYPEWFHDGKQIFEYFKMQTRVRVSPEPFFKNVPNRGTWKYKASPENKVVLHRDDEAVLGKVNLIFSGEEATSNVPLLIPYQISSARTFNSLSLGFV